MCKITFYTDNSESGNSESYSGQQAKASGLMGGIDSLVTDENTWVIVYDDDNYKGNYLQIEPSTPLDDLNNVQRGSDKHDDWKAQIKSFVMFSSEPPFFYSDPTNPTIPIQGCQVLFCEDENYSGQNIVYSNAQEVSDADNVHYTTNSSTNTINNTSSLKVGDGAWLAIYDQNSFIGNSAYLNPGTKYETLNDLARDSGQDWKNQIHSFIIYDECPSSWKLSFDSIAFQAMYLNNYDDSTLTGSAFGYQTQDAKYRLYYPVVTYPDTDTMNVAFSIDHLISGSTDDHIDLVLTFTTAGTVSVAQYSWSTGESYGIPKSFIYAVDASSEAVAAYLAAETAFLSEAAANAFIEAFTLGCKVFNAISNAIANWSESDGGRFYFLPVLCHTIMRACSCVTIKS